METNGGDREPMPAPQPGERRAAAIVAADVVGYTRLMEADEAGTHARLMHVRSTLVLPTRKRSTPSQALFSGGQGRPVTRQP